jgi:class 3 adenylate cyclase
VTEPEEAMNVLREYHAALGELIFKYEGTLDRYAGDGVMVLFNAPIQFPDHTKRAVKMAVEMRDTIGALTERWRNCGHSLGFGMGIALGYATLGQIGFEQRLEYAAIGSVTNLASRLCDEAKANQIVVSRRVWGMVEPWVEGRPIDDLHLKGFNHPFWRPKSCAGRATRWRWRRQLPRLRRHLRLRRLQRDRGEGSSSGAGFSPYPAFSSSCAGLTRASTPFFSVAKTWMAGTSPDMTSWIPLPRASASGGVRGEQSSLSMSMRVKRASGWGCKKRRPPWLSLRFAPPFPRFARQGGRTPRASFQTANKQPTPPATPFAPGPCQSIRA